MSAMSFLKTTATPCIAKDFRDYFHCRRLFIFMLDHGPQDTVARLWVSWIAFYTRMVAGILR
jgi:hypothetical protein